MKNIYTYNLLFLISFMLIGCNEKKDKHTDEKEALHHEEHKEHHDDEGVVLTVRQLELLAIKIDTITQRNMGNVIKVNGQLGVPPQKEAVVTTSFRGQYQYYKRYRGKCC